MTRPEVTGYPFYLGRITGRIFNYPTIRVPGNKHPYLQRLNSPCRRFQEIELNLCILLQAYLTRVWDSDLPHESLYQICYDEPNDCSWCFREEVGTIVCSIPYWLDDVRKYIEVSYWDWGCLRRSILLFQGMGDERVRQGGFIPEYSIIKYQRYFHEILFFFLNVHEIPLNP